MGVENEVIALRERIQKIEVECARLEERKAQAKERLKEAKARLKALGIDPAEAEETAKTLRASITERIEELEAQLGI